MTRATSRPCVSIPAPLATAYAAAGARVPPLSHLLAEAMRAALSRAGVEPPAEVAATPRTARATAARWRRPPLE